MSDLIEEIDAYFYALHNGGVPLSASDPLLERAKDEIERLRVIEEWAKVVMEYVYPRGAQLDAYDMLKEALDTQEGSK